MLQGAPPTHPGACASLVFGPEVGWLFGGRSGAVRVVLAAPSESFRDGPAAAVGGGRRGRRGAITLSWSSESRCESYSAVRVIFSRRSHFQPSELCSAVRVFFQLRVRGGGGGGHPNGAALGAGEEVKENDDRVRPVPAGRNTHTHTHHNLK